MTYEEWLTLGIGKGWITAPICLTHDGTPTTATEDEDYEDGGDPCIFAARLYGLDDETRLAVERNFSPAVWRKL